MPPWLLPSCAPRCRRGGDVQHAVAAEGHACHAVALGAHEDVLGVHERRAVPAPARDGRGLPLLVERLGVAEVDQLVGGEVGVQHHVHVAVDGARFTRDADVPRRGRAGHRRGIELAVAHDAQAPGPLGHEHRAVGEPRHRPRVLEPGDDRGHADALPLAGVEFHRQLRQRPVREPGGRDRNAEWASSAPSAGRSPPTIPRWRPAARPARRQRRRGRASANGTSSSRNNLLVVQGPADEYTGFRLQASGVEGFGRRRASDCRGRSSDRPE